MAFIKLPNNHAVEEMMGVLDSEYDVLKGMKKSDVVIYLIEGFRVTPAEAEQAISRFGGWDYSMADKGDL